MSLLVKESSYLFTDSSMISDFSNFHVVPNFLSTQESEDYPPGLEEALSNAYYGHIRGKRTVKK